MESFNQNVIKHKTGLLNLVCPTRCWLGDVTPLLELDLLPGFLLVSHVTIFCRFKGGISFYR